jgi:hypothetical protein
MSDGSNVTYEERMGSYRYVRVTVDPDGTEREVATNIAGDGLFRRTVYKSGPTEWHQTTGTGTFHARSLADFRRRLYMARRRQS